MSNCFKMVKRCNAVIPEIPNAILYDFQNVQRCMQYSDVRIQKSQMTVWGNA